MDKAYNPSTVDEKWYTLWEEEGFFEPNEEASKNPFTIVLPPPNVTGSLHMGHAFQQTLSDVMIRYKRMKGYKTLWLPGTDHAGIATQTVVEKSLLKSEGKRRKDYSREEFLKHVWAWKEEKQSNIICQMKKLGSSLDWSRLAFTLDKERSKSVRTLFKKLFDDGLIYQGDYLVNWDIVTQTALADDEVEYEDQKTSLWHFSYVLTDNPEDSLTIATTRPETILGDTALAVSPDDDRYKQYVGKMVFHPVHGHPIPIVADSFVDKEFGTGVVKITPAHDPNDYQLAERASLPMVNMMTPDGKVNENGGKYVGQTLLEARENIVADLKEAGRLVKVEPYTNRVGVSYRSKAIIQPYISKQWFIRMAPFKERLREMVKTKEVKLVPKTWENTYFNWIDNLRDWCISRQLWWGHRIPIWYHVDDPSRMICHDGEELPEEVKKAPHEWRQDEDVLDTWFSSAIWPFSTLGWPDKTPDLETFFPLDVMITGHDILFFWVARMMMMSDYVFKKAPFKEVFFNGLIFGKSYWQTNDKGEITYLPTKETLPYELGQKPVPKDIKSQWEKMSKTKGNVIDPIEMIEEYGADATRMALCASSTLLPQIDLDRRRFEDYKNFTNKVWNGTRFIMMNLEGNPEKDLSALTAQELSEGVDRSCLRLEDKWILSRLTQTIKHVQDKLNLYQFDQATSMAYNFYWKDFCSYYLEISKPYLFGKAHSASERKNKQRILAIVLGAALRLMHPMAPFITEELTEVLKNFFGAIPTSTDPYVQDFFAYLKAPSCMVANYPEVVVPEDFSEEAENLFEKIEHVIYNIRNIRGEMRIPANDATDLHLAADEDSKILKLVQENEVILHALTRLCSIHYHKELPEKLFGSVAVQRDLKIFIPLPEELLEKEKVRLQKEKERLESNLEKLRVQLENPQFVERAPETLVNKQRTILSKTEGELKQISEKLSSF